MPATRAFLLTGTVALLFAREVRAADFYVDPGVGSAGNDGSSGNPWSTLEEVDNAGLLGSTVGAGDTVYLRSGYHGDVQINGGTFSPPITIAAEAGQTPTLKRLRVGGASGLVFRGLSVSPSHAAPYETVTMVDIQGSSSNITVEGCRLFSEADVSGWTADQWVNRASSGFQVSGDDVTIRGNTLENVRFGISVGGERALIERNTINGFSADGLRGLGNDDVFQYNVVKNAYADDSVDSNHDDGFQSWSVGSDGNVGTGEVRGIILRGNLILNYEDPNQPFRATLQGIGCFDGTFVDWVVENNVVITDHWHGITLLGARGSRIVNNTVIDVNGERPGPPWISIDAHKDGTAPSGCVVRNNLATDYVNSASGVVEDHNFTVTDPFALFVDPAGHDLRLLPTASDAIDQGSLDLAPAIDADGIPRPQGAALDLGAFERHDPGVTPVDGGIGAGGSGAGSGGSPASNGGTPGGGGSGGASGPGGTSGGGRSGGVGGSGAAGNAGGTSSSAGGAGGTPLGSLDGGPDGAHARSKDDGGCGCRTGRTAGHAALGWMATALAIAAMRRRRSRERVATSSP